MRKQEDKTCSVTNCERRHTAKGFCSSHYEQFKRGKTRPENFTPLKKRPSCLVSDCFRPVYCKGGCRGHYDVTNSYGVSLVQVMQMNTTGCEICEKTGHLYIDHDHSCCPGKTSCGKCVRGGLCGECNMAIGALGDTPEGVLRAVKYLEKWHGKLDERENPDA